MSGKLTQMVVLASMIAAAPNVRADDGLQLVIPMPPPASRPSDADVTDVTNAEDVLMAAQREADAADAELVRAQGEWKRVARQLRWELEVSPYMIGAKEAANSAKAAYEAATKPVLDSLCQRADYCEACAALARARQPAPEFSGRAAASFEERVASAQAVLDRQAAVTSLERDAFNADPQVVYARGRRAAAAAHLRDVRARLLRALHQDPRYVAVCQALEDAEDKAIVADRQLAAAKLDLSAAVDRVADKEAVRQQVVEWTRRHGLPDPP
jgi:hypothetical protein